MTIAGLLASTAMQPAEAACTAPAATTTCTDSIPGGAQFTNPPVVTLNVNSLTANIAPGSGTDGVRLSAGPQNGGNGSSDLFGDDGGNGGAGAAVNVNYVGGSTTNTVSNAAGVHGVSIGGNGGTGGDGIGIVVTPGLGGDGGDGGSGGTVTITSSGAISTSGTNAHGILGESIGGSGGRGGDGTGASVYAKGGDGGDAAGGGTVDINSSSGITTTGNSSHGIFGQSTGGRGGDGGDGFGIVADWGPGGTTAPGGAVLINNSGAISTSGTYSYGIFGQSVGGFGGDSGGGGGLVAFGEDAGSAGPGGNVSITNSASITTQQTGSHAIFGQSVGGGGGSGGAGGGLVALGAGGATGGAGGAVTIVNNGPGTLQTSGNDAYGIFAQSVGGGGGDGGASGGLVSIGGGGSGSSPGGAVSVTNHQTITTQGTHALGIFAQSVGGGGGSGGASGGLVSIGGSGGGGGSGSTVTVSNSGGITTGGQYSTAIYAQSIGGGGGDGAVSGGLVSIGGSGSVGGTAGAVEVTNSGVLQTSNLASMGIFAQSIGGGGGDGGHSGGLVSLGGSGGSGGEANTVTVGNSNQITTGGAYSNAIFAQSIGGGGGNGGGSGGLVSIGGSGAGGGDGKAVTITNSGGLTTTGNDSAALFAQSIGGGGGNGGFAVAVGAFVSAGFGGSGGAGGDGGRVAVNEFNNANSAGYLIHTEGDNSAGIQAQSAGGGGGNGGWSVSVSGGVYGSVSLAMGGTGGDGGDGGDVVVGANGTIETQGPFSAGINAQSVGGGGGNGGFAVSAAVSNGAAAGISFGGTGGGGGDAGSVNVNSFTNITTLGDSSEGILATSVGGGGGSGGFSVAAGVGLVGGGGLSFGGTGGDGGAGGAVDVNSVGTITTGASDGSTGAFSHAVSAQSVGGGGGNGGFSVGVGASMQSVSLAASFGGEAGGGGAADTVSVDSNGALTTYGDSADGIFAQSVGGGGGSGGFSIGAAVSLNGVSLGYSIGGAGGGGGNAGNVDVTSLGPIITNGDNAMGIQAQSIGGGGGNAGWSISVTGGSSASSGQSVGGSGGLGGTAGTVTVDSTGAVDTYGSGSHGIFAQSVGGGGGNGGFSIAGTLSVDSSATASSVGGGGGAAQHAAAVTVDSTGAVHTRGDNSNAIFAQSIGGGGGNGGFSIGVTLSFGDSAEASSVGGSGAGGGDGSTVEVTSHSGDIETEGDNSVGILAQSIGGGGGNGAFSIAGTFTTSNSASGQTTGGSGGAAGEGGDVTVVSNSDITTGGALSHGILAQSVGGGGGNGGFSVGLSVTIDGEGSTNSVGGDGAGGGNAGTVDVTSIGNVSTSGAAAVGLIAQSIGGGGGNGAFSIAGTISTDAAATQNVGGSGGVAGNGDVVTLGSTGDVTTSGALAHGILAQSVGGGGGNGGFAVAGSLSTDAEGATSSTGGAGAGGGDGEAVTVNSNGAILTTGAGANGLIAQSIGGGGGTGGFSGALTVSLGGESAANSVGGSGGVGGDAGDVQVNAYGSIETRGPNATALLAQSVGGGGGNGGFSVAASVTTSGGGGASDSVGGDGLGGGIGGAVTVYSEADLTTLGALSHGILAQSISGGGGNGGFSIAGMLSLDDDAAATSIGGGGGLAQDADQVWVTNLGDLDIRGDGSIGIFAQSVGGGGGSGGFSGALAISAGGEATTNSVGGNGAGGGNGGLVHVENSGVIAMLGERAAGILAQSIGGGGGNGGFSIGGAAGISGADSASDSVGGDGGAAGDGGVVEVTNHQAGIITTAGAMSYGILAQSVGGGGGNGGFSIAGTLTTGGSDGVAGSVGGAGAGGGDGDTVTVVNDGGIETTGASSIGIFAQSVGGGGGAGGFSGALSVGTGGNVTNSVGGSAAGGGDAGAVTVTNNATGTIHTTNDNSIGILAQSVGGGGGNGAFSFSASIGTGDGASTSVGGSGGGGGASDLVTVTNHGQIVTEGAMSYGIVAQSIGGGGGNGGITVSGTLASGGDGTKSNVGGTGGSGGDGGSVMVTNTGLIQVSGDNSVGIVAQSVGGGGGTGGFAGSLDTGSGGAVANTVGGSGGSGGNGGDVTVISTGSIVTGGANSIGVLAQSVAGGGGFGGFSIGVGQGTTTGVDIGVGASGAGAGGSIGTVTVNVSGDVIVTTGDLALGMLVQGIGGGGGFAGLTVFDPLDLSNATNIMLGSTGSTSGNGTAVSNIVANATTTSGAGSAGVVLQSIGGGGGVAGLAAGLPGGPLDGVDFGNTLTSDLTMMLGSTSTEGGAGSTVDLDVNNSVETSGEAALAVLGQSIGGGGGLGIFAAEPIGGVANSVTLILGGSAGGATTSNDASTVDITSGTTTTHGNVSPGVVAQSIGGGGGVIGFVAGAGIEVTEALDGALGSTGAGTGGDGGGVAETISGDVTTDGVLSHGIVAQSIGAGGGLLGFANVDPTGAIPDLGSVVLGADSAAGGSGAAVSVDNSAGTTITTMGAGAFGILAQSIGGGGGAAQYAGVDAASGGATLGGTGSASGDGGTVEVTTASAVTTSGAGAHGLVGQSIGGGGGLFQAFDASGNQLVTADAGSGTGSGDGGTVDIEAQAAIVTNGVGAFGIIGQSVGGGGGIAGNPLAGGFAGSAGTGNSAGVFLHAMQGVSATALDSVAVYGESSASGTMGDIEITLDASVVQGGSGAGAGVMMVNGADNTLFNGSLLSAESLLAVKATNGNDTIENETVDISLDRNTLWAKITGNIDLGAGANSILNFENSYIKSHDFIIIGDGNLYTNNGIESVYDIGVIGLTELTGNFMQNEPGQFIVDLLLDDQTHDAMNLVNPTNVASFDGEGPLNFLGIDQLFGRYVISSAPGGMTDAGFDPYWIIDATPVGFDFNTIVENGTDLVLYADKPTFLSLVQDPASGTTDNNVWGMADYIDRVEVADGLDNPMARLINMLRFLDDEKELGETLTRLTPHYAVHSYDVANRFSEMATNATRSCGSGGMVLSEDGRCVWVSISGFDYERDGGATATSRSDEAWLLSAGGQTPVGEHWALGASFGGGETDSTVFTEQQHLSETNGDLYQANLYAKYDRGPWFADLVLMGGWGRNEGLRDTSVREVLYVPEDVYVDGEPVTAALEGIGDTVTYEQKVAWAGGSSRLGYTSVHGAFYFRPLLEGTVRWLKIDDYEEEGSLAAMAFESSDNVYVSGTPALELGVASEMGGGTAVRAYVRGGVELSPTTWEMPAGFVAAASLDVAPLILQEDADSPVGRVDVGLNIVAPNGSGLKAAYRGAFSEDAEQHELFGKLNLNF